MRTDFGGNIVSIVELNFSEYECLHMYGGGSDMTLQTVGGDKSIVINYIGRD